MDDVLHQFLSILTNGKVKGDGVGGSATYAGQGTIGGRDHWRFIVNGSGIIQYGVVNGFRKNGG